MGFVFYRIEKKQHGGYVLGDYPPFYYLLFVGNG